MQTLTTMGAPLPPMPLPGMKVSQQPQTRTSLSACMHSLDKLACLVGPLDIALGLTKQKTPLPTVSLLLHE
jgi:hypothetical protein